MQAPLESAGLRPKPPPLWYVTNGQAVVGPVTTNLLLRGVAYERVRSHCMVRERSWNDWRPLDLIREVAALRRQQARYGLVHVEKTRWQGPWRRNDPALERLEQRIRSARDPGEVLLLCLAEAVNEAGALVGAVHRRRAPYVGLVTSCVRGPGMHSRLGRVVADADPVVRLGWDGITLCAPPAYTGPAAIVCDRLGALPAEGGVAMAPVRCGGKLYALVELGRPGHPFRDVDFRRFCAIVRMAAQRIESVRNRMQA